MNNPKLLLGSAVIISAVCYQLVNTIKTSLMFHPTKNVKVPNGITLEDVYLDTMDGDKIHGWFYQGEKKETILYCHGNAGNIGDREHIIHFFKNMGYSVFMFDYSGYGRSTGKPSEKSLFHSAQIACEYLVKDRKTSLDNIIIFGSSIGSSVASWLTQYCRPRCLILQAPFYRIKEMVPSMIKSFKFTCPEFDTITYLKNRMDEVPVLVLHSPDDALIPCAQGEQLCQEIEDPKLFIKIRGTHSSPIMDREYHENISSFIEASTNPMPITEDKKK